jgi:hypothetical protein
MNSDYKAASERTDEAERGLIAPFKRTQPKTETVTIAIGDGDNHVCFHALDTDAPKDYDGFGTFSVCEYDKVRTVLVRSEHLQWQTMRYQSGNHYAKPTIHRMRDIEEALWIRIRGGDK